MLQFWLKLIFNSETSYTNDRRCLCFFLFVQFVTYANNEKMQLRPNEMCEIDKLEWNYLRWTCTQCYRIMYTVAKSIEICWWVWYYELVGGVCESLFACVVDWYRRIRAMMMILRLTGAHSNVMQEELMNATLVLDMQPKLAHGHILSFSVN